MDGVREKIMHSNVRKLEVQAGVMAVIK